MQSCKMSFKDMLELDAHFNKKFILSELHSKNGPKWSLPSIDTFPIAWVNDALIQLKHEINAVKNQLSDKDIMKWSLHTAAQNIFKGVVPHLRATVNPELCTQAWCKFYEILCSYPIIASVNSESIFNSFHLCEAPGAFIPALNHYLKLNFPHVKLHWKASTLNPYFEGNELQAIIQDDRFIRLTFQNWCFGEDNSGNILLKENREQLYSVAKSLGIIHLVTADGSIDCQNNPGEQENTVAMLHLAETLTALKILSVSGSFVLKLFSFYEHASICILYLLSCTFEQVNLFKPGTSSSGNSEVYVVALRYIGHQSCADVLTVLENYLENNLHPRMSLFRCEAISPLFIEKVIACAIYFKNLQSKTILENLRLFERTGCEHSKKRNRLKSLAVTNFVLRYGIDSISESETITDSKNFDCRPTRHKPLKSGSFLERIKINELLLKDKINYLEAQYHHLISLTPESCLTLETPAKDIRISLTFGKQFTRCLNSSFCDVSLTILFNQLIDCFLELREKDVLFYNTAPNKLYLIDSLKHHFAADNQLQAKAHSSQCQHLVDYINTSISCSGDDKHQKLLVGSLSNEDNLIIEYETSLMKNMVRNYSALFSDLYEGDHLLLLLHPLLTRTEVGLAYILTHAFETVKLHNSFDGYSKGFLICQHFKQLIKPIVTDLYTCQEYCNPNAILEVVSTLDLLEDPFYRNILKFNCDFISKMNKRMIDIIKPKITEENSSL